MNNNSKLGMFTSSGRLVPEPLSKYRTPFQRDRDRIIHSASFRRLKHKTQVFVNTEGDHYRTRITHSIEVAQIARSISSYLGLNDDLSETLSLAHDLGHTPFGHAGEDALNDCMSSYGGFDHNLQTLRIVMFLENKYLKFKGLNLTIETLEGLLKHNGPVEDLKLVNTLIGKNKFKNKINFKTAQHVFAVVREQVIEVVTRRLARAAGAVFLAVVDAREGQRAARVLFLCEAMEIGRKADLRLDLLLAVAEVVIGD